MGKRNTETEIPLIMLSAKQPNIAKLNQVTTAAQFNLASIHTPKNLPAARSTKKIEMAYVATKTSEP